MYDVSDVPSTLLAGITLDVYNCSMDTGLLDNMSTLAAHVDSRTKAKRWDCFILNGANGTFVKEVVFPVSISISFRCGRALYLSISIRPEWINTFICEIVT